MHRRRWDPCSHHTRPVCSSALLRALLGSVCFTLCCCSCLIRFIDIIVFVPDGKFLSTFTDSVFYITCFCFHLYYFIVFLLLSRGGSVAFSALIKPCRRLLAEVALTPILPVCWPSGSPPTLTLGFSMRFTLAAGSITEWTQQGLGKCSDRGSSALLHLEARAHRVKQTQMPWPGRSTHRACVPQPMLPKHQTSDQGRAGSASLPTSRHGHVRAQQRPAKQTQVRGTTHQPTEPDTRVVCTH